MTYRVIHKILVYGMIMPYDRYSKEIIAMLVNTLFIQTIYDFMYAMRQVWEYPYHA